MLLRHRHINLVNFHILHQDDLEPVHVYGCDKYILKT